MAKKARGPVGRPTKFTPEIKERIVSFIKAGNYLETACRASGVNYSTFRNWMVRGEDEEKRIKEGGRPKKSEAPYLQFLEDIQKAEAEAEARNLMIINKAASDSWQAAAWYLERKHHERWGRKDRVEADLNHSGQIDSNVSVDLSKLTVEELRNLARFNE